MPSASESRKTIGSLNGPWALMLKFALATWPLLMMWCAWVSVETIINRQFRTEGPRVTPQDLHDMESRMRDRFSALPPADWRQRIINVEERQAIILQSLIRIEAKLEQDE